MAAKRVAELRAREYAQGQRTPRRARRRTGSSPATSRRTRAPNPSNQPSRKRRSSKRSRRRRRAARSPGDRVDPASHRRVLRGTTGGERKVISMATYEAREALTGADRGEQGEAGGVRRREPRARGARPERASAKRAEFRSWREGTSARVNETARSKRAAYLQSLKRDESGWRRARRGRRVTPSVEPFIRISTNHEPRHSRRG